MKRHLFIIIVMAGITLLGCQAQFSIQNANTPTSLGTKADPTFDNVYFVTEEDVVGYVEKQQKCSGSKGESRELRSIEPLYYEGLVVFYLVRYDTGWELFTSDKRLPYILAYSNTEEFDYDFFMDNHSSWAENYLLSTYRLRSDSLFRGINEIDKKEINENVDFWNNEKKQQKVSGDNRNNTTRGVGGYWALTGSYDYYELVSQTNHFLPTNWHQYSPYNSGCPLIPNDPFQTRYETGSCALAMALLLYHYHNATGTPETAPQSGFSQLSPIDSTYHFYPTHYSSTVWNSMASSPDSCAALLGQLRYQVGASEDWNCTINPDFTTFSWFVNNLLGSWGLFGQMLSYDVQSIDNTLLSGYPVLVYAAAGRFWQPFSYVYTNNHTYLIDAYQIYRKVTCYIYDWIPDESGPDPTFLDSYEEIEYGPPFLRYYGINFCAGDNASTVWFAKSDAVTYYNNTYQYIRHYLGNMTILEN